MLKFKLKPFDVLYLGGEKTLRIAQSVESIFPPYPHTIAGAISGKLRFSLKNSSPQKPLKRIFGPFLYNTKEGKYYFPKPADIYKPRKKEDFEKCFYIKPLKKKFKLFDIENTNKPESMEWLAVYQGEEDIDPFDGFISKEGLIKWIKEEEVERKDIKTYKEIFEYEPRIGIKQEIATHTVAGKNSVYRIKFVRMKEEWNLVVFVEFADEIDEDKVMEVFASPPFVVKLGGEMKCVKYEVEKKSIKEEDVFVTLEKLACTDLNNKKKIKILYLTPGVVKGFSFANCFEEIEIKGGLVSKWLNMGISSNFLGKYNFTQKVLSPGSVLFGEIKDVNNLKNLWLNPSDGSNNFIGSNLIIWGV